MTPEQPQATTTPNIYRVKIALWERIRDTARTRLLYDMAQHEIDTIRRVCLGGAVGDQ